MLRRRPAFAILSAVCSVELCDGELAPSTASIAVGGAIFCLLVGGSLSLVGSADRFRDCGAGAVEAGVAIVEVSGLSSAGFGDIEEAIKMVVGLFGGWL